MSSEQRIDPPPAVLGQAVDAQADDTQAGARMTFLEHLEELRKRIIYSLYSIIAAAILPGIYANRITRGMEAYFHQVLPASVKLIYTEAPAAFMFELKLVTLVALLIASPFVFAQIWFFVAPGLYTRERRVVIPFVVCASLLFLSGAAFSHYVAFPKMWAFFAEFSNEYMQFVPTIGEAFTLYVKLMLGLGLIFQMPILIYFLTRFGIVTWRFLIRQWRYAIVIIFVIANIVTPSPDLGTVFVFAMPMLALYGLSIGVAWVFRRPETA